MRQAYFLRMPCIILLCLLKWPLSASQPQLELREEREASHYSMTLKKRKCDPNHGWQDKENQPLNLKYPGARKRQKTLAPLSLKFSPFTELENHIIILQGKIEEAYSQASKSGLFESYNTFKSLEYSETIWHALGQKLKAEKWPSQVSWKEVVGGHLFFPSTHIHRYQESVHTEHFLRRIDTIYGCMMASAFRHPLALFYATHILWLSNKHDDELFDEETGDPKPSCYTRLMARACEDLKERLDHPDICYALGKNYWISYSLIGRYIEVDNIEFHKEGKDFKNKFEVLSLSRNRKGYKEPTIDNFLNLAHQGYVPAYIEAAEYAKVKKERDREKEILEEAVQKGYPLAWLGLASWYAAHNQEDHSQECLQKAEQAGIIAATLHKGLQLVGDLTGFISLDKEVKKRLKAPSWRKAAEHFSKAGEAHDPKGWENLSYLYLRLYQISKKEKNKAIFKEALFEAASNGCRLGWPACYGIFGFQPFTDEDYQAVVDERGPAPHTLCAGIEAFLQKEIGAALPKSS